MNKTYIKYLKIALGIIAIYYAWKCAHEGHDFQVFVDAGGKLIHGMDIYKPPFAQNLQYYYSPLFALILAPVSGLPIIIPQITWIFISYFLLYRIWILCAEYFDTSKLTPKQKFVWLLISLLLSVRFILVDIGYVQMTIFLLWATLQSMKFVKQGHDIAGAALLALAINIKFLPLAFVFYLLYRNHIKAALLTFFFYALYLFIPALYLGWDKNISLVAEWFRVINPLNKEWTLEAEDGPSSLVALVPVYITKTTGVLTFKRNFLDLPFNQVSLVLNIIRLFFISLTFAFLKTRPFTVVKSNIRRFWEMSYLFIVIPLIYPHQQQYSFVYIAPAFIYITWFFVLNWDIVKSKLNFLAWIGLIVIGINFTPIIGRDIITSYGFEVLLYLRVLPVAVIMLIPILWLCEPDEGVEATS